MTLTVTGRPTSSVWRTTNGRSPMAVSSSWQHLNSEISANLKELVFADFNGDGTTDIARSHNYTWQVSWGGATPWRQLQNHPEPLLTQMLVGNFSGGMGADVLQFRNFERYRLSIGGVGQLTCCWSQQDML